MFPPLELEGRYVRLEPLSVDHLSGLTAAASGSRETFKYTWVPADEPAMRRYVDEALALRRSGAAIPFATVQRSSGRVLGSTRFFNFEYFRWPDGARSPPQAPDAVEIGWTWLAPDAQRTAINTEAKLLMLSHAFESWKVVRVNLRTDALNARSRAAIERLGAQLDGILRAHVPSALGGVRDTASYSLLAEEWPAAKEHLTRRLQT
ncbi:MAG TPA: GNAT family protein [Myxococcales bacterium]|nr:GNAT family protein [Myxococcales bacterium]